jgi:ABC-type multidrug transport system ATPase subunit
MNDVTLDVRRGEFFGIVGRNGSGKSTTARAVAEGIDPYLPGNTLAERYLGTTPTAYRKIMFGRHPII